MKIEKLTENKIRIIINSSDLEFKNLGANLIMSQSSENNKLFLHMLDKAKKEVGFDTKDCKLLIEAITSSDDILVFTITKYPIQDNKIPSKKYLTVKRKNINPKQKNYMYSFSNIEEFCNFCEFIAKTYPANINKISKKSSLYLYHNTYYLLITDIDTSSVLFKVLYFRMSEFLVATPFSSIFENKLLEHGQTILKKNALEKTINYFVH